MENARLHFKASFCLVCNKVRCVSRRKEPEKAHRQTTKTVLRVRDDEKCEAFFLARVHVGPEAEGGGVEAGGGVPGNLSVPIASSLLLQPVHSSVTALRMEAIIINLHSHSAMSRRRMKLLTKRLKRCKKVTQATIKPHRA